LNRDVPLEAILDALTEPMTGYLSSLPSRRVWPATTPDAVRQVVDMPLPDRSTDAVEVVTRLAAELEPFVTAHASGRYFGFVIGGLHPAAYGAELLAASWDQNAGLFALAPGVAIAEEVAARWIVELLSLPEGSAVGFVTGGQMANFTCLAAARDHVLRAAGWDVEAEGLPGAPRLHVVVKTGVHATVPRALRYLGLGERTMIEVASDDQDRIVVGELDRVLRELKGPTIVCAEAGNVNTGAFDDLEGIADAVDAHRERGHPSWVHVDGAVGLLAAAVPGQAGPTAGLARLDSWSTDAHKLLNVAYDCGIAITRHSAAHRAAMSVQASYLVQDEDRVREALDWNPEFSRRARGFGVYATLRSLGRSGVVEIVARTTGLARRFAKLLTDSGHAEIVNDVVFNQVLVRWLPPEGWSPSAWNDEVIARVQREGIAFFSGTSWRGERMMRISVSDHATDEQDVDRAVAALLLAARAG
jgi:glutamate/tyrosine decarboxylase-like PLP-dependent enzyme